MPKLMRLSARWLLVVNFSLACTLTAHVSYTHLDVDKRQAVSSAAT